MNSAKYIIILTIVSSLRYIISLRYLPTSKFNITLKITKLSPFFDPTEFLRVLYRGVGTMIRARVRVERSRKGWSWKDGWNGEKRGRWDICNSNPIFDLVPLSPTPSNSYSTFIRSVAAGTRFSRDCGMPDQGRKFA